MIATLLLGLALSADPAVPPTPSTPAAPVTATKTKSGAAKEKRTAAPAPSVATAPATPPQSAAPQAKPDKQAMTEPPASAKPAPSAAEAPSEPMSPQVKTAVDRMQKFYEETRDFQGKFKQTYTYKSFGRSTHSSGVVKFLKIGASMRWDYLQPTEKVFVVAGNKVYAYDKEAKQLVVSGISADQLSASITFLWGQGKLEREFNIKEATRKDLTGGIALELIPKRPDPRFERIFFLIDPKTYEVRRTIVVDPDGSENDMTFLDVKTNTGFGTEAFKVEYPPDTKVERFDR